MWSTWQFSRAHLEIMPDRALWRTRIGADNTDEVLHAAAMTLDAREEIWRGLNFGQYCQFTAEIRV